MLHELKIIPRCFSLAKSGRKNFEIRANDRDFNIGDRALLKEFDLKTETYTGRSILVEITDVFDISEVFRDCVAWTFNILENDDE